MKLQIETLTPIFIGTESSEALSPYSDYVWENCRFNYIDHKKLEQFLTPQAVQLWVDQIKEGIANTKSTYTISTFLNQQNIPLEKIKKRSLALEINPGNKKISRFIHTAGRPYIPGSSVKGAIRTALLFKYLEQESDGNRLLNNMISQISKVKNLEKQRQQNFKEIKQEKRKLSGKFLEQNILGNAMENPFKNLHIGDSAIIETEQIAIIPVARFHLRKESQDTPLWREALKAETKAEIRVKFGAGKNRAHQFWQCLKNWHEMSGHLNYFSHKSIEREMSSLSTDFFKDIRYQYDKLLKQINNLKQDEAIIRIGAGKTFFDNTIDLLLERFPDKFYQFRQIFNLGRNPIARGDIRLAKKFPLTRAFVCQNRKPVQALGWIKIKKLGD